MKTVPVVRSYGMDGILLWNYFWHKIHGTISIDADTD